MLDPFVDDELGAARSLAVARHVESCPRCRAEVDAIRALDERIRVASRKAMPTGEDGAHLRARLLSALDRHIAADHGRAARRGRIVRALRRTAAIAASALLAVFILIGASAGPASAEFVHEHVICRSLTASEMGAMVSDPRLLEQLCADRAGPHARVLKLDGAGLRLLGGRACAVGGDEYVHLVYGAPGREPISLFVGRRYLGLGGLLGPNERAEQASAFDVTKVRCPSGAEYVIVAGAGRGAALAATIVAQVNAR